VLDAGFADAVADAYDEIGEVDGYAGIRRPLWPPAWPPWRTEAQLWLMKKRADDAAAGGE
jgi:hypothetical protein